jgi:hypothetical protein
LTLLAFENPVNDLIVVFDLKWHRALAVLNADACDIEFA